MRKRLNESQAEFLGLEPKLATEHGNPKYTITKTQHKNLIKYQESLQKDRIGYSFDIPPKHKTNTTGSNVLVIGDTHEPFVVD